MEELIGPSERCRSVFRKQPAPPAHGLKPPDFFGILCYSALSLDAARMAKQRIRLFLCFQRTGHSSVPTAKKLALLPNRFP